jgi:hypothetical protein
MFNLLELWRSEFSKVRVSAATGFVDRSFHRKQFQILLSSARREPVKRILWLVYLLCGHLLAGEVIAANHYVRAGASGTGSGADWTNAYTSLPATLVRGDTYYIAAGTYSGVTFKTATSGTTLITIKKATVADHGIATGWLDSYAAGQANFTSELIIESSNWVIDGQTGGGPGAWNSGFGFKITSSQTELIRIVGVMTE